MIPGVSAATIDGLNFAGFNNEGLDFLVNPSSIEGFAPYSTIGLDTSLDFIDFNSVLS